MPKVSLTSYAGAPPMISTLVFGEADVIPKLYAQLTFLVQVETYEIKTYHVSNLWTFQERLDGLNGWERRLKCQ